MLHVLWCSEAVSAAHLCFTFSPLQVSHHGTASLCRRGGSTLRSVQLQQVGSRSQALPAVLSLTRD